MFDHLESKQFPQMNVGFNSTFQPSKLSIGLVVPIERYENSPTPHMIDQLEKIQLAEHLGFSAVWLRDVPFNVPSFGDAGQVYDRFVYLGLLAGQTSRIALGVASIILPVRHPAHIAKAVASVDALSSGRMVLGVASGDRPDEYPAMNMSFQDRGERFREAFDYIRQMAEVNPAFTNLYGRLDGTLDMLPKPVSGNIPMLITGASRQSSGWIAKNGDGWMIYPRSPKVQSDYVSVWRSRVADHCAFDKPVMQSLYIDLVEDADASPQSIHLGFRSGVNYLRAHLTELQQAGINHVALNLRFNQADIEQTLRRLSTEILPEFTG